MRLIYLILTAIVWDGQENGQDKIPCHIGYTYVTEIITYRSSKIKR